MTALRPREPMVDDQFIAVAVLCWWRLIGGLAWLMPPKNYGSFACINAGRAGPVRGTKRVGEDMVNSRLGSRFRQAIPDKPPLLRWIKSVLRRRFCRHRKPRTRSGFRHSPDL